MNIFLFRSESVSRAIWHVLIFWALLVPGLVGAQVSVYVSPDYSAVHHRWSGALGPGQTTFVSLPDNPYHDRYLASVNAPGGTVRLVVFDNRDIGRQDAKQTFLLDKTVDSSLQIGLPAIPSARGITLVIKNVGQSSVVTTATVFRVGRRPPEIVNQLHEYIEMPIKALDAFYVLPQFVLTVKPCGTVNAFSSPDIVICTELIADLADRDLSEALHAVVLHEVAHSLLFLWKLPGHDSEDMADGFVAAFLGHEASESLEALIKYLEAQDSIQEAVVQLVNGDRHTVSVQRARNLKAGLATQEDLIARWGRLLAPYARKSK